MIKRFIRAYRHWRYRRLYRKLLRYYVKHTSSGYDAGTSAYSAMRNFVIIEYYDVEQTINRMLQPS